MLCVHGDLITQEDFPLKEMQKFTFLLILERLYKLKYQKASLSLPKAGNCQQIHYKIKIFSIGFSSAELASAIRFLCLVRC